MTRRRLATIALVMLSFVAHRAAAQDPPSLRWTIVPYIGIAQHSPVGSTWGVAADRSHLFLSVQLETSVLRVGRVRLLFAPNLTPLVRLSHSPSAGSSEETQAPRYAVGIAPFGLALQLPITREVTLFGGGAVGALWFDSPVPVPDARAFNVTIEWGGGVDLPIGGQRLRLGYKFHHLSNVYSAPENPGVDGHLFYAGWRLNLTAPR